MKLYLTLLLSLALLVAPESSAARRVLNRTIITVNGDIILESDIREFAKKLESPSFQELFGGIDPKVVKDREALIQLLVDETLINQQVEKLQLTATDAEIDGQIRAIVKRNGITTKQLRARLKQLGSSLEQYRAGIKRQIERKNLIEREIKPNFEISEEQLRRFYARSTMGKGAADEYKIAHILIENKGSSAKSLARAKKISKEVHASPEKYEDFVKDYSDDTATHSGGGVLGYFPANALSGAFKKIVPTLPEGGISEPIKTSAGYHILKVIDVRKADFSTLPPEQKEMVRQQFLAESVEKRMMMWLDRKKRESYIKRAKHSER